MKLHQVVVFCILTCVLMTGLWAQPARDAPDGAGFALLVDVSDYRDAGIPPLRWKSIEVDKIRDALYSAGGFPESQVRVLAGEDATREGIMESFTAVVESAKARSDARFFLYVKGRSLESGDIRYFLPYDARSGASSTYIGENEMEGWLNQIRFSKALIQATWDVDDQDDGDFSSALADLLRDAKTDANGDRNVTLGEIKAGIRRSGFSENYPIRTLGDEGIAVIRLPSVLAVTSEPSGATILLDDAEAGTTPAQLTDLTPGTHRLRVKADRYRVSAEKTIEIASARGHRVIMPSYKLTPIRVHGTVDGVDEGIMRDVEVQIQTTSYRQAVAEDGSFSFEEWGTYGLLGAGKTYEILAQSRDGLYSGKAIFTFSGTEDIQVTISLAQSIWTEVAEQHLTAGNRDAAVAMLDAKLRTSETGALLEDEAFTGLKPALAQVFLTHLEGKLESEPDDLKAHIAAARLASLTGDVSAVRRHWKAVRAVAASGTEEHEKAAIRLRQTSPLRQPRVIALLIACAAAILAALVAVVFYVRRRIRLSIYREIPNPYSAGRPITERDMFFGREDVFAFIMDKFSRDAKDITIVLHGDRRTGKTSIMHQIEKGRLGEIFMPVFIDIQMMAGVDTHDFFRIIAQKVDEVHRLAFDLTEDKRAGLDELCSKLEDKSQAAYQSFNDFLTGVASTLKDKYIIFLIDEYERLEEKVDRGEITGEIFMYLRHLIQNVNNLAFIFSGSSEFQTRDRQEWALMLNMAVSREISFLRREDAIALITGPVREYMRYDRKAVERILRLTAGHPFFTQAICQQVVDDMNDRQQNRVTVAYVDETCRNIVENPPLHLAFIWGELTSEEKIMVALLAEALPDGSAYAAVDDIISIQPHYELDYDRATISKAMARLMIKEHLIEKRSGTETYRFRMDLIHVWVQSEHSVWGALREVQNNG